MFVTLGTNIFSCLINASNKLKKKTTGDEVEREICCLCCTCLDPNIFPEGQLDFKSRQAVLATEVASGSERNIPTEDKNVPVEQNRLFQASKRKTMPRDQ